MHSLTTGFILVSVEPAGIFQGAQSPESRIQQKHKISVRMSVKLSYVLLYIALFELDS